MAPFSRHYTFEEILHMEEYNNNLQDEPLHHNPQENLRIENELLKLKLQAERGAVFSTFDASLPAELEAAFLQQIQLIEETYEQAKETTLYDFIGKPDWKKAEDLDPEALKAALIGLLTMMEAKSIFLDVFGEYPPAVIYAFITGELFRQPVMPLSLPGFIQCFIYEEFHPNHNLDIERTAKEFIDHWFRKEFNEYSIELAGQFITAAGRQFTRAEVLTRITDCLDYYQSFSNQKASNIETGFEWDDRENRGMGYAEGMISYDARLENGEIIPVSGPFKLYMNTASGFWQIFYFVFPGFAW